MPKDNKRTNKASEVAFKKRILKALLQLDEDFFKNREYEVHFVVPYDEDGGEVRGIVKNFTAESPADAVRYVTEKYDFPENDDESLDDMYSKYGIVKVRKVLNEKDFTGEDMLKSWEFIFNHYSREVNLEGTRIKSNDNREEVLMSLIRLFKLPKRNKLTDKYKL